MKVKTAWQMVLLRCCCDIRDNSSNDNSNGGDFFCVHGICFSMLPGISAVSRTHCYAIYVYECVQLESDKLFEMYKGFIEKYPVVSIEDAFDQDDWDAWTKMNAAVSIQLVGLVSPVV